MVAVTWLDVVKTQLAANPGKSVKDVVPHARKEWNLIKSGKHPTKTQGKMVIKRKKTKKRHPHKGEPSRTRPGRLDFRTHKGDKYFHERGHVVKKGYAPYTRKRKHHKKRRSNKRRSNKRRSMKGGGPGGIRGLVMPGGSPTSAETAVASGGQVAGV